MSKPTIKILASLNANGDLTLEEISKILPKKFQDHRDFYPLASLLQQGLVEDSFSAYTESSESTKDLASKTQLISWQLYACSAAENTASYKGHTWSIYGGKESLRSQKYALTGSGYLHLEELRVRRNDRIFAVFLAVVSAIIASYFTTLFGQ